MHKKRHLDQSRFDEKPNQLVTSRLSTWPFTETNGSLKIIDLKGKLIIAIQTTHPHGFLNSIKALVTMFVTLGMEISGCPSLQ